MIRHFFHSIGMAFIGMQRKPIRSFGTAIIVSVLFFVVFLLLMLTSFTQQSVYSAGKKVQITFFLESDVAENQLALFKAKLLGMEKSGEISSLTYLSAEKTLEQFAQENPDRFAFIKQNIPEEMPKAASFTISPGTKSIEYLLQYLLTGEFKDAIDTNRLAKSSAMIVQGKRLLEFLQFLEYGIFGVIGVVMTAMIVVFAWFLSAEFTRRKKEIFVMRLVGGSAWFIRIPFLVEAFFMASVSLLLGWTLFFVLRYKAIEKLLTIFSTRSEVITVAKTINAMWAHFLGYLPYMVGTILLIVLIFSFMTLEYLLRKRDILE